VQQQFHIRISLLVTLETGVIITVAEIESSPLVVRGRNPSNFVHQQAPPSAASLSLQQSNYKQINRTISPLSSPAHMNPSFKQNVNSELNSLESRFAMHGYTTTASSTLDIDEAHYWLGFDQEEQNIQPLSINDPFGKSSPTRHSPTASYSYPPTSLRISDGRHTMSAGYPSTKYAIHGVDTLLTSTRIASTPHNTDRASPSPRPPVRADTRTDSAESGEPLYEYFPLGLNGWMPPVDAVYRPHVAHDTVLVPELKRLMIK
jgi:hypothetical protein